MEKQYFLPINVAVLATVCLLLTACGGGGSSDGAATTGAYRSAQNIVYLDDASNQHLMAAYDDGSVAPFSLLSVNGGIIVRNSIRMSPDRLHVAFTVSNGSTANLYISHVNGAYVTRVTTLATSRQVTRVLWAPDSRRLIYLADANVRNQFELFMTTLSFDSRNDLRIATEIISGTVRSSSALDIASPSWSPEGSKVAYTVTDSRRATRNKVVGLNYHDTRIGGRHSIRLTPAFRFSFQDIPDYKWSPDGLHIAYRNYVAVNTPKLFKLGFGPNGISHTAAAILSTYYTAQYAFSADSRYLASRRNSFSGVDYQLVTEPSGSGLARVQDTSTEEFDFKWAHHAARLAYTKAAGATTTVNLYSLNMDNSGISRLSTTLANGDKVSTFSWAPGNDYLGYLSNQGLYLVRSASPAPVKVQGVASGKIHLFGNAWSWSHDGNGFAYGVGDSLNNTTSLYVHYLDIAQSRHVAGPFASGQAVLKPKWSRDDERLAFRTYQGGCDTELYSASSSEYNVVYVDKDECQSDFAY